MIICHITNREIEHRNLESLPKTGVVEKSQAPVSQSLKKIGYTWHAEKSRSPQKHRLPRLPVEVQIHLL